MNVVLLLLIYPACVQANGLVSGRDLGGILRVEMAEWVTPLSRPAYVHSISRGVWVSLVPDLHLPLLRAWTQHIPRQKFYAQIVQVSIR